jgi:hypothetical protein
MAMNVDLGDPDAWDDSALTNSWNEALQEYKARPKASTSRVRKVSDIE